jgi:hypothetical protein
MKKGSYFLLKPKDKMKLSEILRREGERGKFLLGKLKREKKITIKGVEGEGKTHNPFRPHKAAQPNLAGRVTLTSQGGEQKVTVH